MDKLTSLLLLSAAQDDQGIYPVRVVNKGVDTFRTPWQDGWNAAVMALTKNWINLRGWFDSLPIDQQEVLARLLALGAVDLSIDEAAAGVDREITIHVSMNDTFGYASADSEEVPGRELGVLEELWEAFGDEGLTAYAAAKRGQEPIEPRRTPVFVQALIRAQELLRNNRA